MHKIVMDTFIVMWVRKQKKYSLTLNNYRNRHFQVSNTLKDLYKTIVKQKVAPRGNIKFKPPLSITFVFYKWTKRKADIDWMCVVHNKFFCDALVELWFIDDDDCETIRSTTYIYGGYGKWKQRIEILVDSY